MILPLTNNPEESFSISIFDNIYNFRQLWNEYGFWSIDILDADSNPLVYGVKLVTRLALLKQYVNIDFDLISQSENDPTRSNLNEFNLQVIGKNAQ